MCFDEILCDRPTQSRAWKENGFNVKQKMETKSFLFAAVNAKYLRTLRFKKYISFFLNSKVLTQLLCVGITHKMQIKLRLQLTLGITRNEIRPKKCYGLKCNNIASLYLLQQRMNFHLKNSFQHQNVKSSVLFV